MFLIEIWVSMKKAKKGCLFCLFCLFSCFPDAKIGSERYLDTCTLMILKGKVMCMKWMKLLCIFMVDVVISFGFFHLFFFIVVVILFYFAFSLQRWRRWTWMGVERWFLSFVLFSSFLFLITTIILQALCVTTSTIAGIQQTGAAGKEDEKKKKEEGSRCVTTCLESSMFFFFFFFYFTNAYLW